MLGTLVPLGALGNDSPLEYVGGNVLPAAASSIVIPVNPVYTLLMVECWITTDAPLTLRLRLNGDSGANYDYQYVQAGGTTVDGARATGQTQVTGASGAGTGAPIQATFLIAKTTAGTAAQVLYQVGVDAAASIKLDLVGGQWNNTSSGITGVTLLGSANNFAAGSTFAVYGLRG